MRGVIVTFVILGIMALMYLAITNDLGGAGSSLMQNTAGSTAIVP